MKKIITTVLAIVMICTAFTGFSAFAEAAELTYTDHLTNNNGEGYDYDITTADIAWVKQANGVLIWVKADDARTDEEIIAAAKAIDNSLNHCTFAILRGAGLAQTPNENGSQAYVNVLEFDNGERVLSIDGKYSHFVMGYDPNATVTEPESTEPEVYEPEVFEPEVENDPIVTGDAASIRIDVPQKMAVAFDDGTVYYGGEMKDVVVGQEYMFQMCSVNWENGLYDEENGLLGTVVYRMIPMHRTQFVMTAKEAKQDTTGRYIVKGIDVIDVIDKIIYVDVDAEGAHLETDVNAFFMAYRFSFEGENYDHKTGIDGVVAPTESLSVNLPLGSTVTCNIFVDGEFAGTENIFVEHNSGVGEYDDVYLTSVNDVVWNLNAETAE